MISSQQVETFADLFVGRWSDYALQQPDGRYLRVGSALSLEVLSAHLMQRWTVGTYVMDEANRVRFAVFDADAPDGLFVLAGLQSQLAQRAIPSYLEASRRGGHLWVLFATPVVAALVRAWLLPCCPAGVEFYPKQGVLRPDGYGSLMRVPLGRHQRSGQCYPFVIGSQVGVQPVSLDLVETLEWLSTCARVVPPALSGVETDRQSIDNKKCSPVGSVASLCGGVWPVLAQPTIADWCASVDPFELIGRYVELDARGMGCCPFGSHHDDGVDTHPSLRVYQPATPGGCCWYCYTWGQGGNVFNFLQYYYGLSARTLWGRLLAGESL